MNKQYLLCMLIASSHYLQASQLVLPGQPKSLKDKLIAVNNYCNSVLPGISLLDCALYIAAVENRDCDDVQFYLGRGANMEVADVDGWRALHKACKQGNEAIARLLLARGAEKNARTTMDLYTPLHIAVLSGKEKIVHMLITQPGVEIDAQDKAGWTALHFAVKEARTEIIKILLGDNHPGIRVDTEIQSNSGIRPIHIAAKEGKKAIVMQLCQAGADKDAQTQAGLTALHIASMHGKYEVVNLLLEQGANKDSADNEGFTALHIACLRGHKNIVRDLLKGGADKNYQNAAGFTPLHCAVDADSIEIVLLLLASKVDVEAKTKPTALVYADMKAIDIAQLPQQVSKKNQAKIARLLFSYKTIKNRDKAILDDKNRLTRLLTLAIEKRSICAAQVLLSLGADKKVLNKGRLNKLLDDAVERDDSGAVRALLELGASIEGESNEAPSPYLEL